MFPIWWRKKTENKQLVGITRDFSFLHKKTWQWLALIFLAFIWGSSFILMKHGLESFSSNQVAAMRIFISFLLFIPFIYKTLRKLKRSNIISLLIVGFIGNLLPAALFTVGQTEVSSSLAGILNSLVPLFSLMIGALFFKSKSTILNVIGILIGLGGTISLVLLGETHFQNGNTWFAFYIIAATVCYSISANVIKHKLVDLNGLSISSLSFLMIGPVAGVYLIFTDFSSALESPNFLQNLGFITILAVFSSFAAVIVFNVLIKYTTTIFATSVTYIIPIFAIMWGIADGESITLIQYSCMIVILLGVYLVNRDPKTKN
jgi:drug/metabolite transporter (DMT)-like permease